jgi:hypothetical protein
MSCATSQSAGGATMNSADSVALKAMDVEQLAGLSVSQGDVPCLLTQFTPSNFTEARTGCGQLRGVIVAVVMASSAVSALVITWASVSGVATDQVVVASVL